MGSNFAAAAGAGSLEVSFQSLDPPEIRALSGALSLHRNYDIITCSPGLLGVRSSGERS